MIKFYRATGQYGFMSNLYRCEIAIDGKVFRSSEDAYQYGKPKDVAVAEWLISAPKPHLCAIAAHALLYWDIRPDWKTLKLGRMRAVLKAKFDQNIELKGKLMATGETEIIEDSKTDAFWGIGKKGTGKNMLGKMLMDLRTAYQEEALSE